MDFWNKYRWIVSLILLVTVALAAGCSPSNSSQATLNETSSDPSSSEDWSDTAEGETYAEALDGDTPAGQLQLPQTAPETDGDKTVDPSPSPDEPVVEAESAPLLDESPSQKAAPVAGTQPETEPASQADQDASSAAAAAPAGEPTIGFQAPDFSLATLDGQPISLADLRGKNVLLNYWVTWCIPCIEEMPILEKLNQEYQDQEFVILSVNGIKQDELETVKATLGEFAVTFPVTLDESNVVYDTYQVQFMPTSFFIDDQGVIRYIQLGSSTEEVLRTKIEELISDQL